MHIFFIYIIVPVYTIQFVTYMYDYIYTCIHISKKLHGVYWCNNIIQSQYPKVQQQQLSTN